MNIPVKKLQSGFELPVYGLGLWEMGGRTETDTTNDAADIAAIDAAIKAGVTHIDTAESYGAGHAEELLAQALKLHDRSKLIIASKVSAWNQGYDGVLRSFEATLKRLDTDYLDLYLLHRYPEPGIDIADTMRAIDRLVTERVVKNIGACNLTPRRFDEAQRHSGNKLVCNQVHYNVQYREAEAKNVLQHAQANDVMLVAWRPIQKGSLPNTPLLNDLAAKYNKTPLQIAINWLISQGNVATIAKTTSLEHLQENLGALDFTMTADDIEKIRQDYPDKKYLSDAVPLDYAADTPA
jgi:diketogulonate reductase-like aldo/keto reductase